MSEQSSIGVKLRYSADGVTYTSVGCILDIDYPGPKKDIKEGTCLSQTDRWKTFFGAFVDQGEITVKIKYSKTMVATMLALVDDQEPAYWQIVVPDGADITDASTCSRWTSLGLLQDGPGLTFPSDGDKLQLPLTIKLSGSPTWTQAA